ncbi:MAG: tetraacyldisaccharide 4'-kinase [Puniceicoccaceae bacterium]|nr:MAG: tetraacyldisaccharide 4'-kinase [Puniceicoccaceae bacterium]
MALNRLKKRLNQFELYTIEVILDKRHGKRAACYKTLLWALSLLFRLIAKSRWWLYQKRLLQDQYLGCLVVVVGNLTVGGTGKTPVVEKFARALADRGRKVAILSRGYKSRGPATRRPWWQRLLSDRAPPPPKVVSDGTSVLLDSETAGDEPFMLARNLPGVVVLVDKNRVKSGTYAIRKFGCDTLVLDDGFQYLPLKSRLNLLLVDKTNPFGNRQLLPRGILREPVSHIRRASYVFLTKCDGRDNRALIADIRRYHPTVDIIECAHRPAYLQEVNGPRREELSCLQGRRVGAFSGIAAPDSFENFLRQFRANLIYTRRFLDHYRFTGEDLDHIVTQAMEAGLDFLVTTEKDAVRITEDRTFPLPVFFLRLEIEILSGVADFQEAVSRICFPENRSALSSRDDPAGKTAPA